MGVWIGVLNMKVIPCQMERSPNGAFVCGIHRGTLRTVENTGKLIKLRDAADHSTEGGNTGSSSSDAENKKNEEKLKKGNVTSLIVPILR